MKIRKTTRRAKGGGEEQPPHLLPGRVGDVPERAPVLLLAASEGVLVLVLVLGRRGWRWRVSFWFRVFLVERAREKATRAEKSDIEGKRRNRERSSSSSQPVLSVSLSLSLELVSLFPLPEQQVKTELVSPCEATRHSKRVSRGESEGDLICFHIFSLFVFSKSRFSSLCFGRKLSFSIYLSSGPAAPAPPLPGTVARRVAAEDAVGGRRRGYAAARGGVLRRGPSYGAARGEH